VDFIDFTIFSTAYNSAEGDPNWNTLCDMDDDGVINFTDFNYFANTYGTSCD
jgi:hypothetical protein